MSDLVIPPGKGLVSSSAPAKKRKPVRFGLATRVLLLNTVFVIVAAMLIVIASNGYERATIQQIAKQAQAAKPATR